MNGYKYKEFQSGQEKTVSEMVWNVFNEFVAPGYPKEGIDTFMRFTSPESLVQMLDSKRFFGICCWYENQLAGFVLVRDFNHISLLFVDKQFQKQGISKELLRIALHRCSEKNPFLAEITVNAAPFAVEAYKKLGFAETGESKIEDGIIYIPMSMKFKSEFSLSEMSVSDYDQIYDLWKNSDGIGINDVDTKERLEIFIKKNPNLCYITKKDEKVIGTILCGCDGRRGYIYHAAVNQEYRGHGIGRIMVEIALFNLKELGIRKCHLFTFKDNETGKIFWTTLGWQKRDDLLIFSKELN